MESLLIWTIGAIATLSSGGFIYLLNKITEEKKDIMAHVEEDSKVVAALGKEVDKNRDNINDVLKRVDALVSQMAIFSKDVETKTSFRYVNDEFYKKEMAKIQFDNISQQMSTLIQTIEKLSEKIDKNNHRSA